MNAAAIDGANPAAKPIADINAGNDRRRPILSTASARRRLLSECSTSAPMIAAATMKIPTFSMAAPKPCPISCAMKLNDMPAASPKPNAAASRRSNGCSRNPALPARISVTLAASNANR